MINDIYVMGGGSWLGRKILGSLIDPDLDSVTPCRMASTRNWRELEFFHRKGLSHGCCQELSKVVPWLGLLAGHLALTAPQSAGNKKPSSKEQAEPLPIGQAACQRQTLVAAVALTKGCACSHCSHTRWRSEPTTPYRITRTDVGD